MLSDEDRAVFDMTLDTLADTFRITKLDLKIKNEYFKALKRMSPNDFFTAIDNLREKYRKKSKDDFPVPVDFFEYLEGATYAEPVKTWKCRCCEIPFPAGELKNLKCACDLQYCFRCSGCGNHCACPEGMMSFDDSEVAREIRRIVASAPTWRSVLFKRKEKTNVSPFPASSNPASSLPPPPPDHKA